MPLLRMGKYFPDLVLDLPEVVADREGLLFVQKVECWTLDRPEEPWETILIYKSPLVTGTSRMYRCVVDLLLPAETVETLYHAETRDESMMHGVGICTLVRLDPPAHARRELPANEVRSVLDYHVFESIKLRYVKASV